MLNLKSSRYNRKKNAILHSMIQYVHASLIDGCTQTQSIDRQIDIHGFCRTTYHVFLLLNHQEFCSFTHTHTHKKVLVVIIGGANNAIIIITKKSLLLYFIIIIIYYSPHLLQHKHITINYISPKFLRPMLVFPQSILFHCKHERQELP